MREVLSSATIQRNAHVSAKSFIPTCLRKSAHLAGFGLKPDKTPAPPTGAQKQERVAKALATRKARGTMGKKQKAAIKGTVPAPAQAAPAPAPTPTPAAGTPAPKAGS